jgi:hypothetical protein
VYSVELMLATVRMLLFRAVETCVPPLVGVDGVSSSSTFFRVREVIARDS